MGLSVNKVIQGGYLGKFLEQTEINGKAKFTGTISNKLGKDYLNHRFVAWGKLAEIFGKYCTHWI